MTSYFLNKVVFSPSNLDNVAEENIDMTIFEYKEISGDKISN